jgi:hypothetical protein
MASRYIFHLLQESQTAMLRIILKLAAISTCIHGTAEKIGPKIKADRRRWWILDRLIIRASSGSIGTMSREETPLSNSTRIPSGVSNENADPHKASTNNASFFNGSVVP